VKRISSKAPRSLQLKELAIKHSDFDVARARSEEGLQLYRRIGSVLGEATCIMTLGDIAFGRSDLDTALLHFDEARFLARHIGAMSSEAGCCRYLGLIAFARFDYERAATRFQEALALSQRAGDILNEAETMIRLGQAKQKSGDSSGLEDIKLGFSQYFGLVDTKDRARAGWQAMQLALTISDRSEAGRQRESARSAWTAVGRLDLVRTWADVI
jgi:tetratricopeptide (TPR) repeat protein